MAATLLTPVSLQESSDHTIPLTGVTANKTLIAFLSIAAGITLHSDSTAAGWVVDNYTANTNGFAVLRLPAANNAGGSLSLRVTHNGPRALSGAVLETTITGAPTTASVAEQQLITASSWATAAQTFAATGDVFAVIAASMTVTTDADLTGWDQGFTEIADSGFIDGTTAENGRVWVGYASAKALTAQAVTGTMSEAFPAIVTTGVMGYPSAAAAAAWSWTHTATIG